VSLIMLALFVRQKLLLMSAMGMFVRRDKTAMIALRAHPWS